MALTRVSIPTPTAPAGTGDYTAILAQIEAERQAFTLAYGWTGSTIKSGRVFNIGEVLYKSTSDTAISGTVSNYVKITPSGATATASFVSSLTGVAWNHEYGGYYDGSGNLYIFDESKALYNGVISTAYTAVGLLSYIKNIFASSISASTMSAVNMSASVVNANNVISSSFITGSGRIEIFPGDITEGDLYSALVGTGIIDNIGDSAPCIFQINSPNKNIYHGKIYRLDATRVAASHPDLGSITATSGSSSIVSFGCIVFRIINQ